MAQQIAEILGCSSSPLSVCRKAAPVRASLGMFRPISDPDDLSSADASGSAMVMVGSNKKCPHLSDPPHAKYRIENAIVFTAPSSRVAVDKNGDNPPEEALSLT